MPDDDDTTAAPLEHAAAARAGLADQVEGADLATREGRLVAVRAFLVGLLRGHVRAAEARAGAALLTVAAEDAPDRRPGEGAGLVAELVQVARRTREQLELREEPVTIARPDPWRALVVDVVDVQASEGEPTQGADAERRQRHG